MYTLFIDTHTNKIVMVLYKNRQICVQKELVTEHNHSNNTMPILVDVLNEAKIDVKDLNEILVVNGPGSFTGVRIGVTIAKTLAYTLQIPIKVLSSLLVKAVSFAHDEVSIVEREKNGVFLGTFDKENHLVGEYSYISTKEYELKEEQKNCIEDVSLDYLKIYDYASHLPSLNPHAVNPLYVKIIEVQK